MKEKKFNYIHLIITILVTAFFVCIFMLNNNVSINKDINVLYEEIEKQNDFISSLEHKIDEQNDFISDLEEQISNIKSDTEEIIGYVDSLYVKFFPESQSEKLIVTDN